MSKSSALNLLLHHADRNVKNEKDTKDSVMLDIYTGAIPENEISLIPLKYLNLNKLPGVPTENIMTSSVAYKPFRYEFGHHMFLLQNQMLWLPEDIPLADDISDWKNKLTDDQRSLMTKIFPLFVQNDFMVNNVYIHQYAKLFKPNEIQMGIIAVANIESIHEAAYAYLLDSLSFPENIYSEFLNYKEMNDKYNYTAGFRTDTLMGIAVALVMYGGMTEGLQLFATFAIMLNFPRHNLLKGMGQIVSYSVKDEGLHVEFVAEIFKTFMSEFGHLIDYEQLTQAVNTGTRAIVGFENVFSDMAFSDSQIKGITLEEHKQYIEYIANMRLKQFGFKPIFDQTINPYPWIDTMIGAVEMSNFFEQRSVEYTRGATTGTWEDAWKSS